MSESTIGALLISVGALITAAVAAWVSLRKQRAEERKAIRNGVIEEWREITNRLQARVVEQEKKIDAQGQQIIDLVKELAALRIQIEKRETERIELRGDLREVTKQVVELKQPDTKQ